jgi:hypothetical protein
VHAAEGVLQEIEPNGILDFPVAQFATWLDTRDSGNWSITSSHIFFTESVLDDKYTLSTMYEDKENFQEKSELPPQESQGNSAPRRMSLLRSVLGLKFPKSESTIIFPSI